jgi:hypothetical protein
MLYPSLETILALQPKIYKIMKSMKDGELEITKAQGRPFIFLSKTINYNVSIEHQISKMWF